ncbi:hypothetical protein XA68_14539 [Ophiocordyceps unilateralis]|uniref:Uncharacterized protein n=1 Tax=Ophiocordyceps unilateralis TaxID=268505 RepID=A0A2A9PAC6_OPHUN|nr:hypothetical protein XA68_14539 [Ophiocordyceps unilateralis]
MATSSTKRDTLFRDSSILDLLFFGSSYDREKSGEGRSRTLCKDVIYFGGSQMSRSSEHPGDTSTGKLGLFPS